MTDSSDDGDMNNPSASLKLDNIWRRSFKKYDENKAALKNWKKLRRVLKHYLSTIHENKQKFKE